MADKIKDDSERVAAYSGETVVERFVKEIAVNVADDLAYRGLTLRQWADKIVSGEYAPVVRGGWIPLFESEISGWNPEFAGKDPIGGYMCSVCKEEAIYDCNDEFVLSNYCPNCGAKMDGGDDCVK